MLQQPALPSLRATVRQTTSGAISPMTLVRLVLPHHPEQR